MPLVPTMEFVSSQVVENVWQFYPTTTMFGDTDGEHFFHLGVRAPKVSSTMSKEIG